MTPIAPHLCAFLNVRLPSELGASQHTRASYAYAFQLLFQFASERLGVEPAKMNIEQFDTTLLLAFLEHLERDRKNSVNTRNVRLAAIKSFFKFLQHRVPSTLEQVLQVLALPAKKTDSRLVGYLALPQVQALLDAPDPKTRAGLRDRAMLYLALTGGLRVSELVGLTIADINLGDAPSMLILGKGRRQRHLPLSPEAVRTLRAWLAVRGNMSVPELFVNARGHQLNRAGFAYILKKYTGLAAQRCSSLASKRVSPHVLRHTCAVVTLQATGDLRKVALWLGHASTSTTEVYARLDPTEKLEAIEAIMPATMRRGRFRPPDALLARLREASRYAELKTNTSQESQRR